LRVSIAYKTLRDTIGDVYYYVRYLRI